MPKNTPIEDQNESPEKDIRIHLYQMCVYGYPMDVSCSTFDPNTGLLILGTSNGLIKVMGGSMVEYDFNINNSLYAVMDYTENSKPNNKPLPLTEHSSNPLLTYRTQCNKSSSKSFKSRFIKIFKKSSSKDESSVVPISDMMETVEKSYETNGSAESTSKGITNNQQPNHGLVGIVHMIVNHLDNQLFVIDTDSRLSCWDLGFIVKGKLKMLSEIEFKYGEKLTTMCILNGIEKCNYKKFACCGTVKGNVYMVELDGLRLERYCIYWNKSCKGATSKSPGEIVCIYPNIDKNPNLLLIGFKQGLLSLWNISEKVQHKLINLKRCITSCSLVIGKSILVVGTNSGGVCVVCVASMSVLSDHYPNDYILSNHQNITAMGEGLAGNANSFFLVDEISSKIASHNLSSNNQNKECSLENNSFGTLTLQPITVIKALPLTNNLNLVVFAGGNINTLDSNRLNNTHYNLFMNIIETTHDRINSTSCTVHLPVPIANKNVVDIHIYRNENQIYTIVLHKNGMESFMSNVDELIERLTSRLSASSSPQKFLSNANIQALRPNTCVASNLTFKVVDSPYSFLNNNSAVKHMAVYTSTLIVLNVMSAFPEFFDKTEQSKWPIVGGYVGEEHHSKKSVSIVILTLDLANYLFSFSHSDGILSLWKCAKSSMTLIIKINVSFDINKYFFGDNEIFMNNAPPDVSTQETKVLNTNNEQLFLSTSIGMYHHLNNSNASFCKDFDDFKSKLYSHLGLLIVSVNNSIICIYSFDSQNEHFNDTSKVRRIVFYMKKQGSISVTSSTESIEPYTHYKFSPHSNCDELVPLKLISVLQFVHDEPCSSNSLNVIFLEHFNSFLVSFHNVIFFMSYPSFEISYSITFKDLFAKFTSTFYPPSSAENADKDVFVQLGGVRVTKSLFENYVNKYWLSPQQKSVIESIYMISYNKIDEVNNEWVYTFIITCHDYTVIEIFIPKSLMPSFFLLHCPFATKNEGSCPKLKPSAFHILCEDNNFISLDDQYSDNQSIKIKFIMRVDGCSIDIFKYEYDTANNQNFLFPYSTYNLISNSDTILKSSGLTIENHSYLLLVHKNKNQHLLLTIFDPMIGSNTLPQSFYLEQPFVDFCKYGPLIVPCDRREIFLLLNYSFPLETTTVPSETYSIYRIHPTTIAQQYGLKFNREDNPLDKFYPSLLSIKSNQKETTENDKWNKFVNFFQKSFTTPNKFMDYECIFSKSSDIAVLSSVATTKNFSLDNIKNINQIEANDPLRKAFLEREEKLKDVEIASKNMADNAKNFNDNINRLLDKNSKNRWF